MTYKVKEVFYTLQGEGSHSGRPAVFCRFSLCNLWNGRERDRHRAVCKFCDTDFVGTDGNGGGRFETADELAGVVASKWPTDQAGERMVVCTGGEPLLQLDNAAISALHEQGFYVAVETNGTVPAPSGIDWLCVSPKANSDLLILAGNELKLVFPQKENAPSDYEHLEFECFRLQPLDGPSREENTAAAIQYCLAHPRWRLSLQIHKILGIP